MPTTKIFALSAAAATAAGSATIDAACHDRDAGEPGARRFLDGARPDRRQVEAAVLLRLRRLDQHAGAGRRRDAPRARSSAMRASIASVPSAASTASTWLPRDDRGLAHVERSGRVQQREGARDVGAIALAMAQASRSALRASGFPAPPRAAPTMRNP